MVRAGLSLFLAIGVSACGEHRGDGGGEAPPLALGALEVLDLTISAPIAGERAALYATVRNRGQVPDTLRAVIVTGVSKTSLHRSLEENGRMTMRPVAAVEIPSAGEVVLRPGGLHGMLEGFERDLQAGDTLSVQLEFALAGALSARAPVVTHAEIGRIFR